MSLVSSINCQQHLWRCCSPASPPAHGGFLHSCHERHPHNPVFCLVLSQEVEEFMFLEGTADALMAAQAAGGLAETGGTGALHAHACWLSMMHVHISCWW
jgi:hypothetical protein